MTVTRYIKLLKAKGYKQIGKGAYARVFARSRSKTVIKVGADDPYLKYVRAITSNPLFPKIFAAREVTVRNSSNKYYVVKMERLIKSYKVTDAKQQAAYKELGIRGYCDFESGNLWRRSKNLHVMSALPILRDVFKGSCPDLHMNNVMWRCSGKRTEVVITDPIC